MRPYKTDIFFSRSSFPTKFYRITPSSLSNVYKRRLCNKTASYLASSLRLIRLILAFICLGRDNWEWFQYESSPCPVHLVGWMVAIDGCADLVLFPNNTVSGETGTVSGNSSHYPTSAMSEHMSGLVLNWVRMSKKWDKSSKTGQISPNCMRLSPNRTIL